MKINDKLSPRAVDDFKLVQSAIGGDERAYATLMNRYRNSVFHAMYKMVNNRDDADDLTIEAFGKAFRKLPTYAPNYAFSTWLFKIAINNCIDHIRKKRLQTLSMDDTIMPDSDREHSHNIRDYEPDPERMLMHSQKLGYVRRLVENMNIKYRTMIELRYYEELSYEEIAQELKLPLGTVKAQLFRAKEILSQQLQAKSARAYLDIRMVKEAA
jgi:RNA polymerase sigma factor (sigma-70 family)